MTETTGILQETLRESARLVEALAVRVAGGAAPGPSARELLLDNKIILVDAYYRNGTIGGCVVTFRSNILINFMWSLCNVV